MTSSDSFLNLVCECDRFFFLSLLIPNLNPPLEQLSFPRGCHTPFPHLKLLVFHIYNQQWNIKTRLYFQRCSWRSSTSPSWPLSINIHRCSIKIHIPHCWNAAFPFRNLEPYSLLLAREETIHSTIRMARWILPNLYPSRNSPRRHRVRWRAPVRNCGTLRVLNWLFFCWKSKEMKLWILRRPRTKQMYPGMLDVTVAGTMIVGELARDCVSWKSFEEASLPVEIVQEQAKEVASVSHFGVSTGDTKHGGGERRLCLPGGVVWDIAKRESTA
jgi:hypothetical protein